jgi:hypothetical protein
MFSSGLVNMHERRALLSVEAAATLVAGLIVGLIPEMEWWLRALGVFGTCVLAIHTGKRIEERPVISVAFPLFTIFILVVGTWQFIWQGFHQSFPGVTEDTALSKIIEFSAVATSGFAGYYFIIRPRSIGGYKVLPAQIMAFGIIMMTAGLLTACIGLIWQFRQNWNSGTTPAGAPLFSLVSPQIQQTAPHPALPPPNPATATPFFSGYNLTDSGVTAFAEQLFAIRDAISRRVDVASMNTDPNAGALVNHIERACDQAGVECPTSGIHPNSPNERGLMIYVSSPEKPPEAATKLQEALLKIGVNVPFVARPGLEPTKMVLFVGPTP